VQELQAVRSQVEDHLSGPGNLKGPAAVGDSAAQQDAATSEAVGRLFAEGSLESDVRVGRAFRVCVCVRTSVVPTGLGSISHFTQHSASGSVLGQTEPRLRCWIFR